MEIYTESKPKETHSLPKSGIASLAIRVPKSNPTVKKGHPMIGLNEWLRSKAQGERVRSLEAPPPAPINTTCLTHKDYLA
ncbi:hypothetical protein Tco_0189682 [Tanacetum coccineum]